MKKRPDTATRSNVLMVIPTLGDRLELLQRTLQSIADQKPARPDIVVVCPLENKAACKLAKKFNAALVEDPGGLSAALNAGFASAKSWHEFGAWMGDDDLLRPNSLKITLAAIKANSKAVLAFGYCDYVDENDRTLFTSRAGGLAPWLMTWGPNLVPLPGLVYRLSAAKAVGGYDESLKYAMDLDMWLRLKDHGKLINTKQVVGAFRWHPTSTTVAGRKASLAEAAKVKKRYLSQPFKSLSPVWELPVQLSTRIMSRRLSAKAQH